MKSDIVKRSLLKTAVSWLLQQKFSYNDIQHSELEISPQPSPLPANLLDYIVFALSNRQATKYRSIVFLFCESRQKTSETFFAKINEMKIQKKA